jgi:hypothetical protein
LQSEQRFLVAVPKKLAGSKTVDSGSVGGALLGSLVVREENLKRRAKPSQTRFKMQGRVSSSGWSRARQGRQELAAVGPDPDSLKSNKAQESGIFRNAATTLIGSTRLSTGWPVAQWMDGISRHFH